MIFQMNGNSRQELFQSLLEDLSDSIKQSPNQGRMEPAAGLELTAQKMVKSIEETKNCLVNLMGVSVVNISRTYGVYQKPYIRGHWTAQ